MIDKAGGSSELEIWPDQMHVFQALPRLVPEADRALAHASAFIAQTLDTADTHHDSKEQVTR